MTDKIVTEGDSSPADRGQLETPIMQAARESVLSEVTQENVRRQSEAEGVLQDVDEYIRSVNPPDLDEAERQLAQWQVPEPPLTVVPDYIPENEGVIDPGPMTSIFQAGSEMEAQLIMGLLGSAGVPSVIDNFASREWGESIGIGEGCWGHILVGEAYAAKARSVIDSARDAGSDPSTDS